MASFAFSTVLLLAVLYPGLVFFYAYSRSSTRLEREAMVKTANDLRRESGRLDEAELKLPVEAPAGQDDSLGVGTPKELGIEQVMKSLPVALLFHVVWGALLSISSYPIDYDAVMALLTGIGIEIFWLNGPAHFDTYIFVFQAFCYFFSQVVFAVLAGYLYALALREVGYYKDLHESSKSAHWIELFNMEPARQGADLVVVTVNSGTRLYRGVLETYQTRTDGMLERVTVKGTRVRLNQQWVPIAGEQMVLSCVEANSVTIDYLWLEEQQVSEQKTA